MPRERTRVLLARYAAPAAFLAAATAAVLLIRAAVDDRAAPRPEPRRAPVATRPAAAGGPTRNAFYVIRAGDTLEDVARRFGTTVDRLLALNPGIEPTSLRIGQRVRTA